MVAQTANPGNWGLSIRLGARVGLIVTGSGHVILAFQSAQQRGERLAAHEAMDAVDGEVPIARHELDAVLTELRHQRFWRAESQQVFGVTDISVPVLGPNGAAHAVLTCPYVKRIDRHPGLDLVAACEMLQQAAQGLGLE